MGDGRLKGAAAYLAGVLHGAKIGCDHVESAIPVRDPYLFADRGAVILSDYPAAGLGAKAAAALLSAVQNGCGLLMVGGWASFRGQNGLWDKSPVREALPVHIAAKDDRINCGQGALVRRAPQAMYPLLSGLPWESEPPMIGGFCKVRARRGARVLLEAVRYRFETDEGFLSSQERDVHPLLVAGMYGNGRSAALTTDVAPHWVGPLIDWGSRRLRLQAPGANPVEVGSHYAKFLEKLVRWTARL
ncbi:MAG: hypothetical protein A2X36_09910 [Elusimicrobia bacterium GWA2_69_24]|nr:MAG: hypothetical protein A2X36_09910 [Elusimicrobia bacterium GWA2_69_24]